MIESLEKRVLLSTTYYVSTAGNDGNPGTSAKPWQHIQKAFNSAKPGSTVIVEAGTYREKPTLHVSGNASAGYITFQASGHVVIDGSGIPGQNIITIADYSAASYVRIEGFEIIDNLNTTQQGAAIWFEGSGDHVQILNNIIHHFTGFESQGIGVYGSNSKAAITNLLIQGNTVYDGQPSDSETITVDGNVTGFQINNNTVHDVNNIGIDMIGGEGISADPNTGVVDPTTDTARNGLCQGNRVYNAHQQGPRGQGFAAGIYVDGGKSITVQRNTVSSCDIGIEIGCETKGRIVTGVVVRDNVVYNNDHFGIGMGGYDTSVGRVNGCRISNNTVYKNDALPAGNGSFGGIYLELGAGNHIINNIVFATTGEPLIGSQGPLSENNFSDYNLFFGSTGSAAALFTVNDTTTYTGLSVYVAKTHLDSHSKFADPKFIAAGSANFHLSTSSPAINAGDPAFVKDPTETDIDGQPRIQGGRVDIGADEVR